jgi:hypothetical protein
MNERSLDQVEEGDPEASQQRGELTEGEADDRCMVFASHGLKERCTSRLDSIGASAIKGGVVLDISAETLSIEGPHEHSMDIESDLASIARRVTSRAPSE